MKKIDKLVLGAFAGPFVMTFLVVVFILLTQHMLKYFDDIIGKGLGWDVIGQLLFYFAIFMTPVALPLAVLLSSLIAFGNLGEHFELTAIKSSGISLVRTLRPIFFFVVGLTVVAFYANNNLVPKAALEAYSLLYDIKQKKPALDLREGAFYNGINDISIKVNKKYPDGITLKEVVVYDHRKNDGNKEVTVADSGKMYTILNERYLKFELFNGYRYTEGGNAQRDVTGQRKISKESLSRTRFGKSEIVFDLSSFDLPQTDKRWFEGNRIMRNISQLEGDMDSIRRQVLSQHLNYYQYRPSYFAYYWGDQQLEMPQELVDYQRYRDSVTNAKYIQEYATPPADAPAVPEPVVSEPVVESPRTVTPAAPAAEEKVTAKAADPLRRKARRRRPGKAEDVLRTPQAQEQPATVSSPAPEHADNASQDSTAIARASQDRADSLFVAAIDSVFHRVPQKDNYQSAANAARQVKTNIMNANASAESYRKDLIIFEVQWHKILASSLACIAMFLIGAPLGAIIKKGGLGMPFLVSILFFIVYYVLTMQGEKLAKQETVSPTVGVWMADAILVVIGLFFLRQARADARLFEADFYNVVVDKLKRWFASRAAARRLQQG